MCSVVRRVEEYSIVRAGSHPVVDRDPACTPCSYIRRIEALCCQAERAPRRNSGS